MGDRGPIGGSIVAADENAFGAQCGADPVAEGTIQIIGTYESGKDPPEIEQGAIALVQLARGRRSSVHAHLRMYWKGPAGCRASS
jgi:hypothetical protein